MSSLAKIRVQNLAKLMKELERDKGISTYKEIHEKYGVSAGYLSQVMNGTKEMGERFARKMETLMGLPEFYMDRDTGVETGSNAVFSNKSIAFWSKGDAIPDGMKPIQFLPDIKASLGGGYTNHDYHEEEYLWFRTQTLNECNVDSDYARAIHVVGESMSPELADGQVIAIDTSAKRIYDGEIYAFKIGDELKVKYLFRHGDGFKAVSRNDDKLRFPDEYYTAQDIESNNIEVLGQFWWKSETRRVRR